eukprot:Amastigsp_a677165_29.p4 type:complete len:158 gc:universal Amastigsp_a677165_29:1378-905(-)
MLAANSVSLSVRAARTSMDDDVTPPLFADASLKSTTPASSSTDRASGVMKRFAPSTIHLKRGAPFESKILWTFDAVIDSGRPPQGTKRSADESALRWNESRSTWPEATTSPLGSVTSRSLRRTRNPCSESLATSKWSMVLRALARRVSSSRLRPAGS